MKDLLARERHIEEAQRLCRNMQSQIDALHDSLLPSPTNNPATPTDVLRPCGPQPPRHPPCEGPAADINVDVSVTPPRQRVKPRQPQRSTIPQGAKSPERMPGALGEWFLAGSGHGDPVRRNSSLLNMLRKCAGECAWDSWSTLPQDWKERFLSWGNRHIPLATTRRTHSTKFSRVFAFMIVCNYEANPRYCTFANSWSTPCREHSTCLYLCTVLLLRLVHET